MLVCWGLRPVGLLGWARVGGATAYAPPGATIGGEYTSPGMIIHPLRDVWWGVCNTPLPGSCIRVPSGTRPASLPRQGPSADARAFLRSDRNKCTSSSCFCLRILIRLRGQRSIRKTCVSIRNITYFIPPCTWPECSFCRRPICCLSAPYASRGVPEIREPQTILYVAINTSEVGFFWGGGGKTKAGYTLRKSSTCTRLFAFRVQCLAS